MIVVEGLDKRFGAVTALQGVSLSAEAGEVVGVVGPNGAGKTTLFRILATLARPSAGRAAVCGYDVVAAPAKVRALIGAVFTEPALYGHLTPRELLTYFGRLYGLGGAELTRRIRLLEESFGLDEVAKRLIEGLSRGMKQRVALARAVVHAPPVLLLDEPTTGLDFQSADRVLQFLSEYARDRCILFATHNFQELELACQRVVVLNNGRVLDGYPIAEAADSLRGRVLAAIGG